MQNKSNYIDTLECEKAAEQSAGLEPASVSRTNARTQSLSKYVATFEHGRQSWCVQLIEQGPCPIVSWHKSKDEAQDEAEFLNDHPNWHLQAQSKDGSVRKYEIAPICQKYGCRQKIGIVS